MKCMNCIMHAKHTYCSLFSPLLIFKTLKGHPQKNVFKGQDSWISRYVLSYLHKWQIPLAQETQTNIQNISNIFKTNSYYINLCFQYIYEKKSKAWQKFSSPVVHSVPTAVVFERLSMLVTQPSLALAIRISCTDLY